MYLRYFGLHEAPFSITPDPAFVYLSSRHRDALAHLLYGIGKGGSGGFVQLTGEVGTGKTTLCRCMLEQIPEGTRIALLLNPLVTPRELLAAISEELEIDTSGSGDSTRLLVDRLNHYLLDAHARGERVVVVIDEAQVLSPEALEQVRLLTNLETAKEKLLQIVLLGQPELRELLQRRNLRQLAQRITARYHLSPLGPKDTHLYIRHRLQVAGAQRNPFRRSAMSVLYRRSQGIPRLINIIADRSLAAAYAKERTEVTAAMVHGAANEVQLGERQVKPLRWPWLAGAVGVLAVVVLGVALFAGFGFQADTSPAAASPTAVNGGPAENIVLPPIVQAQTPQAVVIQAAEAELKVPPGDQVFATTLDSAWLENHQQEVWQGLADVWHDEGAANAVRAACNGADGRGYACLRSQGSWSKIKRLGLPVVLVLQGEYPSRLLLRGMGEDRLLIGGSGNPLTVAREAVDSRWLGTYLVAWPQARGWPAEVGRGDNGPAVATIIEMATRVDVPYRGGQLFDAAFELWLRSFQMRNGLEPDGIVGRHTLLYLMKASIEEPQLLQTWDY
ncbi:MAG: ExeA family protein [Gammaproteobacteria bacterium]|nr:MAG: ExeA family protein [Gammaproteobacteria bacterium]